MNLLDNLTYFLKPGLAVLLIPFFFACNDPSELGLELERDDEKVSLKDTTLVLPSSTIYIDSLRTDQYTNTLFGRYADNTFGEVTTVSNNQYNIGSGTLPEDTLAFKSAVLRLKVNAVRTRSVVGGETVIIHESSDTIFNSGIYLADRTLTRMGSPIAEHTFTFDPEIDSVISVPLNDPFGQALFDKLKKAGSDDTFRDSLLRGQLSYSPIIIEPGSSNQAIYSLDLQNDTSAIYIQMEHPDKQDTIYNFLFGFNNSTRFTSIEHNKGGALLSDLVNDYDESTADTDMSYLDMLSGVHTKIDLTPLIQLTESEDDLIFNSVKLVLEAASTGSSYFDPVNQLRFYFVEGDGTINATAVENGQLYNHALLTELSYTNPNPNNHTPFVTNFDKDKMEYSGNITLFSQILGGSYNEEDDSYLTRELVILSPAGVGIGQTSFPKSGIKVIVYYSALNQ